jgi:hypothetical protein
MTFGLTFKGNLHRFLADSAEIYETVLFKKRYDSSFGNMFNIQNQEAETSEDQRHLIEFTANSIPGLIYSMTKTKIQGGGFILF